MIKIEHTEVYGWEAAIRGMRNPMNSWDKSDSTWDFVEDPSIINPNDEVKFVVGENDHDLMMRLAKAGSVHAKYRRMITVTCDITAPLYWFKEYDTYKVGTVANSCSTMHKITAKPIELSDFSIDEVDVTKEGWMLTDVFRCVVANCEVLRKNYIETKDKRYWKGLIQLLPTSYNQRRTVQLNYEVLAAMYRDRKDHKLDEWRDFCKWVETLPYSEVITLEQENKQ